MAQNEITEPGDLLDGRGRLLNEGWARHPWWIYNRRSIRASWLRIKEWDYYSVVSHDLKRAITFTISDLGYAALAAVCWIDLERGRFRQIDSLQALSMGRIFKASPSDLTTGENSRLKFGDRKLSLEFEVSGGRRILRFNAPTLETGEGGSGLNGELVLHEPRKAESLNIATSWKENRQRFYYNRKINCMAAEGQAVAGGRVFEFRPETAFGGLDWGRGAWTYRNRWYWSSASGKVGDRLFGFNLGYGFSDRSPASENILFVDGRGHKLGNVLFDFDENSIMDPWRLSDDEGRLNLEFQPLVDRFGAFNLLAVKSVQHQVFGFFSGTVLLDDGTPLQLDHLAGFAEDVYNRW